MSTSHRVKCPECDHFLVRIDVIETAAGSNSLLRISAHCSFCAEREKNKKIADKSVYIRLLAHEEWKNSKEKT